MRHFKVLVLIVVILLTNISMAMAESSLITMNIVDEEIAPVLHTLAKVGRRNIVIDQAVAGKVTVQLRNVSFEAALDIVTKIKGLRYQVVGDVIVVSAANKLGSRFGETHIFKLKYANVDDVVSSIYILFAKSIEIETTKTKNISAEGNAVRGLSGLGLNGELQSKEEDKVQRTEEGSAARLKVDKATNSIVFFGTEQEAKDITHILAELDVQYRQVSLEAEVVAINKRNAKDLGVEWQWKETPTYPKYEPPTYSYDAENDVYIMTSPGKFTRDVHWGTLQYGMSPGGYPYEFYYQAKINALVTSGVAKVLSKPKIMTIDGKAASIKIGDEIPILEVTRDKDGNSTTSYKFKDVGIILKYLPRINSDNEITATIHTEVSTPMLIKELRPPTYQISKRSADTQVRLKDGETMVIGGLIGSNDVKTMSKVPYLANIPLFGALFKSHSNSNDETEIIIFLTARIVK